MDSGKPALTTTSAICYLLKNAATVEEALDLLQGIDMHSDIGAAYHYAIADASGRCVVVEYVDNQMMVVESPAVANHYLCAAKLNVGLIEGDRRYEYLCRQLDTTDGTSTGLFTFISKGLGRIFDTISGTNAGGGPNIRQTSIILGLFCRRGSKKMQGSVTEADKSTGKLAGKPSGLHRSALDQWCRCAGA